MNSKNLLPVEIIFHPNWWHRNYGISFEKEFFFDPEMRVANDFLMRQHLDTRFPELNLVDGEIRPRPVIGGTLLAAGYLISAILGCEIKYFESAPPEVIPMNLSDEQILQMKPFDIFETPPMRELVRMMDTLEKKFGYLEGDINWEGVQNVALNLRGPQLFLDYLMNPQLAVTLLEIVADTIMQFLKFIQKRSSTTSISVNRIVWQVNPKINLHSNCTLVMIAPEQYREFLLKYDKMLSQEFPPYGIHYCGNNMHVMRHEFAGLKDVSFYDVGWGSDVWLCRQKLPEPFFSLRLNPVRMLSEPVEVIEKDIIGLLDQAGDMTRTGLCCINMDYGTPDDNVRKIFEVADRYRKKFQSKN